MLGENSHLPPGAHSRVPLSSGAVLPFCTAAPLGLSSPSARTGLQVTKAPKQALTAPRSCVDYYLLMCTPGRPRVCPATPVSNQKPQGTASPHRLLLPIPTAATRAVQTLPQTSPSGLTPVTNIVHSSLPQGTCESSGADPGSAFAPPPPCSRHRGQPSGKGQGARRPSEAEGLRTASLWELQAHVEDARTRKGKSEANVTRK